MWQPSTLIWCKKTVAIWWQTCIIFNHLVPFVLSPPSFISHPVSLWFTSLLQAQKREFSFLRFWSARNDIKVVGIAHQHYVAINRQIGFISAMCRSKKTSFLFSISLLMPGISGGTCAHMCADRTVGAEGQPAGLSGTCPPPCVSFKDTETIGVQRSGAASVSSHCHFEQRRLNRALPLTCGEWSDSFCFYTWQRVQTGEDEARGGCH